MKHKVRTSFGDSTGHYGGEQWDAPPHGTIQGNGASPLIWAAVSSVLFECLKRDGCEATLTSPITNNTMKLSGFAFVDDTDLLAIGKDTSMELAPIVNDLQKSVDTWQGSLRSTGGALDIGDNNKSYWYCIDYEWDHRGRWKYRDLIADHQLTMADDNAARVPISMCSPSEARRTLGVRLAPDGNFQEQTKFMKEVVLNFANKIQNSTLSSNEIKMAVTTRLMPALLYSLPATTLSEVECTKIMAPMKKKILPKMRVVQTISNSVLFGPLRYQGLGFLHLHTIQCTTHISMLMEFMGTATDTGNILTHSLEALNMETGLDGNPFEYDYTIFKNCVSLGWFTHLWEFVTTNNIKLQRCTHVPTPIQLLPQRDNDTLVMKLFVDNGYKRKQLGILN